MERKTTPLTTSLSNTNESGGLPSTILGSSWFRLKQLTGGKDSYQNEPLGNGKEENRDNIIDDMQNIDNSHKQSHKPRVVVFSKQRVRFCGEKNGEQPHQNILHSIQNTQAVGQTFEAIHQKVITKTCCKKGRKQVYLQRNVEEKISHFLTKYKKIGRRIKQSISTEENNNVHDQIINNSDLISMPEKPMKKKEQISAQEYDKIKQVITYQRWKKQKITNFMSLPVSPTKHKQMVNKNLIPNTVLLNNLKNGQLYHMSPKMRNTSYLTKIKQDKQKNHPPQIMPNLVNTRTVDNNQKQLLPPIDEKYKYFSSKDISNAKIAKRQKYQEYNEGQQTQSILTKTTSLLDTLKKFCQLQKKDVKKRGIRIWRRNISQIYGREITQQNRIPDQSISDETSIIQPN